MGAVRESRSGPRTRSMASNTDDLPELLSPIRTVCPSNFSSPAAMPRKFLMLSRAIRMFHVALFAHAGRHARFAYSFGQSAFFIHHMRNLDENSITDIYDEY